MATCALGLHGVNMLRNNLILAFRSLRRNRIFSAINVLGLSACLTACILISLYVHFELSYDDFHRDAANIYRVTTTVSVGNEVVTHESNTYDGIVKALKTQPKVRSVTVISPFNSDETFLRIRDSKEGVISLQRYKGLYADEAFFRVFSFPLLHGNTAEVFDAPYSAVISETLAQRYFDNDAVGKILELKDDDHPAKQLMIKGVMKEVPPNSHVKFDVIVNLPTDEAKFWEWRGHAYTKLRDDGEARKIEEKLDALAVTNNGLKTNQDDYGQVSVFTLQALRDIHLHSRLEGEFEAGGNGMLVYALIVCAVLILMVGWINHINLSVAMYSQRLTQIAVRKIVGASRIALIFQLLTESALLNTVALTIASLLSWCLLATFSNIVGTSHWVSNVSDPAFWSAGLIFLVISTIASGAYPAVSVVYGRALSTIKDNARRRGNLSIGNVLLVFQFTIATILIITTITAYRQLSFMQSQALGIDIDQVLVVKARNFDQESWSESAGGYVVDPAYAQKANAFSNQLRSFTDVVNVAMLSHLPGQFPEWGTEFKVADLDPSEAISLRALGVDYDFIATLGVTLLAGRNFSPDHPSDRGNEQKRAVIINETARKLLGFRNPREAVSRHISSYWGADYEIIGVIESFHQLSLKDDLTPLYFILQPRALSYFAIDLHSDDLAETIARVKLLWSHYFPDYPFDYFFLDDYFNRQYHDERRFTAVMAIFTVLGVCIGCMGLFGLTSYAIVQRTKEIAIRKVLGASLANVIAMFSTDFMKLVVIANFIAIPVACYGLSSWLDSFAYRTTLEWWMVVGPVVVILFFALMTIIAQAAKLAVANPVDSLKSE